MKSNNKLKGKDLINIGIYASARKTILSYGTFCVLIFGNTVLENPPFPDACVNWRRSSRGRL